MAKFTSGDLRLKDSQKVTFGTGLDVNIFWDNDLGDLRIDSTVSGTEPSQSYHLTTRGYVDNELATLSGGIVQSHSSLTGLAADDHTQYSLVAGTRAFTSTVGGVTPTADAHLTTKGYVDSISGTLDSSLSTHTGESTIHFTEGSIDHGSITGLGDDDHSIYSLVAGTRAFTGTVGGVTPTADAHLTTKSYVDSVAQGLDWQDSVLDITTSGIATETLGYRYISSETSGGWTVNNIYEYDGATWDETVVNEGMATWVEDEDIMYVYNGSAWVKLGSTVTHANLSGLQGGTSSEYYHMTSAQHTALTDQGGAADASAQHTHDGRYYTETEVDTISGSLNSGLTTHTGESTIHFTEGSIDHGSIAGLGDDDHTQYILADGSRGFTSTVSGTTPSAGYDLATKDYVDGKVSAVHGRQAIGNGVSFIAVSFSDLGHTNYTIGATLENITDSPPSIYAFIVTARSSSGFTVTFMGDTDSANYVLDWSVILD